MYAVISPDKIQLPPGTVVRMPGSWQDYCALRDSRGDGSIPRIKYRGCRFKSDRGSMFSDGSRTRHWGSFARIAIAAANRRFIALVSAVVLSTHPYIPKSNFF
jgi:hypothetical protein